MKNKYHVYIPSKGRADNCLTAEHCIAAKLNFSIVVEPQDYKTYAEVYDSKRLIKLPKNDQGMWYVRQFILDLSKKRGEKAHWQIDDDMRHFAIRRDGKNTQQPANKVLTEVEKIFDSYKDLYILGTRLRSFAFNYVPFMSYNTQVWASFLLSNDAPAAFRKGTVEDLDFCMQIMSKGGSVAVANRYIHETYAHNKQPGGLTVEDPETDPRIDRQLSLRKMWSKFLKFSEKDKDSQSYINLTVNSKLFPQRPTLRKGAVIEDIPNVLTKKNDDKVAKVVKPTKVAVVEEDDTPKPTTFKVSSNMKITDFNQAKYNPRKISTVQLQALDKSIEEFGDLSGVVINRKTNTIIAGHQRIKTLKTKKTKIVTEKHIDNFGTVETGHILAMKADGSKFKVPLRIVDWDIRKEKLANIAANNHGGEFDNQKLGKLLAELDKKPFDIETTGFTEGAVQNLIRRSAGADEPDKKYVRKLASPVYEITGKKPKLSQVYDTTKTEELKAAVIAARLPKDIHDFLMAAAERHTKFNFSYAAEFYAHAPKKVQALMEDCALVIVDHKKAIEHGYLKLTDEIMDMVKHG